VVADFSYLRCWEGLVFFAFVIDVFSRMIVGWQLAAHMRAELVVDALQMALGTRERFGHLELVHHSDRGSQYTSAELSAVMAGAGVLASVGSTGDAYDNAMAESLVDTYKTELIADRVWKSRSQVEIATGEWVGWYNHTRLHGELGDVPPVEFEPYMHPRSPPSRPPTPRPPGSPCSASTCPFPIRLRSHRLSRKQNETASVEPGPAQPKSRDRRRSRHTGRVRVAGTAPVW